MSDTNAEVTRKKRVLLIASNTAVSPTTGWPIGFWWAELTHPYHEFVSAGYTVDIVSPEGGDLQADGFSDPEDKSGYLADDLISLGFKKSPRHASKLTNSIVSKPFKAFAIRDGNLVTGQQQVSGAAAARKVIEALGRGTHRSCSW